jgi:hypothetical protein
MALGYYSNSVQDLRKQVEYKIMTGSEDHLLMNVVWLYMFEAFLSLCLCLLGTDMYRFGICVLITWWEPLLILRALFRF